MHERGGQPVMEMPNPQEMGESTHSQEELLAFSEFLAKQKIDAGGGLMISIGDLEKMCPVKNDPTRFTLENRIAFQVQAADRGGFEIPEEYARFRPQPKPEDAQKPSPMEMFFGKPKPERSQPKPEPRKPEAAPTKPAQPETRPAKPKPKQTVEAEPEAKAAPAAEPILTEQQVKPTHQEKPEPRVYTVPAQQPTPEKPAAQHRPKPDPARTAGSGFPPPPPPAARQHQQHPQKSPQATPEQPPQAERRQAASATGPAAPIQIIKPRHTESLSDWLPDTAPTLKPLPDVKASTPSEQFQPAHPAEAYQPPHSEIILPQPSLPASFAETGTEPLPMPVVPSLPDVFVAQQPTQTELLRNAYIELGWATPAMSTMEIPGIPEQVRDDDTAAQEVRRETVTPHVTPEEVLAQPETLNKIPETTPLLLPTVESFAQSLLVAEPVQETAELAPVQNPHVAPDPAKVELWPAMEQATLPVLEPVALLTAPETPLGLQPIQETLFLPPVQQEVAEKLNTLTVPEKAVVAPILESITETVTVLREQVRTRLVPDPELTLKLVEDVAQLFNTLHACADPERVIQFVQILTKPQFLQAIEAEAYRLEHEGTHERKLRFLPLSSLVSTAKTEAHNLLGALSLATLT